MPRVSETVDRAPFHHTRFSYSSYSRKMAQNCSAELRRSFMRRFFFEERLARLSKVRHDTINFINYLYQR